MFKRLFWIGLGVATGVLAVSKAQAYVKANTPDQARQFVLGPDQDHVAMRTLEGLITEFKTAQRTREAQLNQQYSGIIKD
ncbi:hypothetical protein [Bifidobacterium gallicum]|uniref:Secreted protein n=1 Tax=Bifidobacterium gallicum DSM 20093 = LMG 11596 TaxID=561180 RepID=D1NSA6_9BIFI|nr:hypothetical protein [Bifidobacterium gallicum]EFA23558.1 hypothetical protein BIFGAL_02662 [Bifidobacterium gallicum DSM 20093 = LMG 11596]KFI58632.1 hypothetical protein BGLCM_0923 [Bifidobacterium gallicum DSM 20093 = LMG 11596]